MFASAKYDQKKIPTEDLPKLKLHASQVISYMESPGLLVMRQQFGPKKYQVVSQRDVALFQGT